MTSQLFLVFFAVCWTAASVALSLRTGQWHWFSRSGAITVIMGAILTVRRLIRLGVQGFVIAERTFNGGHALPTPDEVEAHRQFALDVSSMHLGIILLVLGTIIWAYGDLFKGLLDRAKVILEDRSRKNG